MSYSMLQDLKISRFLGARGHLVPYPPLRHVGLSWCDFDRIEGYCIQALAERIEGCIRSVSLKYVIFRDITFGISGCSWCYFPRCVKLNNIIVGLNKHTFRVSSFIFSECYTNPSFVKRGASPLIPARTTRWSNKNEPRSAVYFDVIVNMLCKQSTSA